MAIGDSKFVPGSPGFPSIKASTTPNAERFEKVQPVAETSTAYVAKPVRSARVEAAPERIKVVPIAQAMATDVSHDGWVVGGEGMLYPPSSNTQHVLGLTPVDGRPIRERILWVNGIMTTAQLEQQDMQAVANTGREVVGIRNATGGMIRDLGQCIIDKMNIGDNPAVDATKKALFDAIKANQPLHLVGHSQGALIISRALFEVRNSLMLESGMNPAEVQSTLSNFTVTTLGGAAASYPDGPRYTHFINTYDAVPRGTGLGLPFSNPGAGAVIKKFSELDAPSHMPAVSDGVVNYGARFVDQTTHGPQDVYLKHFIQDDLP